MTLTTRFLIIGTLALGGLYVLTAHNLGLEDESPLKLGIDLSGGTILVYQIDPAAINQNIDIEEQVIPALKRRINPDGTADITIRQAGADRVEIIIPADMAERAEEIKGQLTTEGSLEFRILASTLPGARTVFPINRLERLQEETPGIVEVSVTEQDGGFQGLPTIDGFRWARLGELVEGRPAGGVPSAVEGRRVTVEDAAWNRNRFEGLHALIRVEGRDAPDRLQIVGNTEDTLILETELDVPASEIEAVDVDYSGGPDRIIDPVRRWRPNRYTGLTVVLWEAGQSVDDPPAYQGTIASNTDNELVLEEEHGLASVGRYLLEYNPSQIQYNLLSDPPQAETGLIIRGLEITGQPATDGMVDVYVLLEDPPDRQNVTGEQLDRVYPTTDQDMRPAVGFDLNTAGSRRFSNLTSRYRPREEGNFKFRLAIILDGEIMSAPSIEDRISSSGIIRMGRRENVSEEVNSLIAILRAGSLPAALETPPLQEERIGPTLGEDTIRRGVYAIGIALTIVPIFMIVYYRFAGVVAVIALTLNMILLLASMAITDSSITLPGLAGLALTIGMAVDANVLIFERIREERDRGAPLGQSIRNGFGRAWSTILDSNVTTILAGAVLWLVGTEEVKGFAIVMIIGLLWNLFTAVFVSRAIFDFAYDRGLITRLRMLRLLSKTNINFVGPRRWCMLGSAILVAIGLGIFGGLRGGFQEQGDMYNIDFTGGTLVTVRLDDSELQNQSRSAQVEAVRSRAEEAGLPNVAVENLAVEAEEEGVAPVPRFNIRTTEYSTKEVQRTVINAFDESLQRVEIETWEREPDPISEASTTFPGGTRYTLTLNLPQSPSAIEETFAEILATADPPVVRAQDRFEVINPDAPPNDRDRPGEVLELETNLDPERIEPFFETLNERLRTDRDFLFERLTNFSGVVAGETRQKAVVAVVGSWLIIIAYLWFRFQSVAYGLAAVAALVHDVLIALGAVALSGYKIDLPMIAAFLTLIGFSVNDTIVIFDRIRELKGKSPMLTPQIVNQAINATLSRTILTSLTSWAVVLIFYLFGGSGLAGFSFCLVVGFVSGTYSTIFIAAPILIEWLAKPAAQTKEAKPVAATN